MKHFLTGAELNFDQLHKLLELAEMMKTEENQYADVLKDKHIALIFEKPSLRTRLSFTVAVHQLGGEVVESIQQTRKSEPPEDLIRVVQGYCHGMVIRTHGEAIIERMAKHAKIPIINGLTDYHHPCQILADLVTLKAHFKTLSGLQVSYIGDGNNILNSLLLIAPTVGVQIKYCCPPGYGPHPTILHQAKAQNDGFYIQEALTLDEAIQDAQAVYTDVWSSMGYSHRDESVFKAYQVTETLMTKAGKEAVFMHCMPINRGKEVTETLPDSPFSVVFEQSKNRLYAQKALLLTLFKADHMKR